MTCNNCNHPLTLKDQEGGTNGGSFSEYYECENCGRTGRIYGESSDPPQQWRQSGVCK